jgi:iron complex outermembrane receptor protein
MESWRPLLSASLLALAIANSTLATAQVGTDSSAPPTPGQTATGSVSQLEDIVVTAQKRGQNLQDVPLSVTAFTGEHLTSAGITSVVDVQQIDPSLNISLGGGAVAVPFMRGIGNPGGINIGNESSVPLYIDDVYYGRITNAYLDLANVERVEVLKGPQGTLFGRNASGGLINVFTRSPDRDQIVADVTAGYANYETWTGKLYASTPLGDRAAIDLSISGKDQREGWGRNLYTGDKVWKENFISLRSKLVAELTDSTSITLIGWYVRQFTQQGSQYQRVRGVIGGSPDVCGTLSFTGLCGVGPYGPTIPLRPEDNGDFYNINIPYNPSTRIRSYGGSLKVEQDVGFGDFVSITSYRHFITRFLAAASISPTNFLAALIFPQDRDITQEFQLKSKSDANFDWIFGNYYLNSHAGYKRAYFLGDIFGFGSSGSDFNNPTLDVRQELPARQTMNSYSAYGQATFHVIPDGTNITLGLRYTIDKLTGRGEQNIVVAGVGSFPVAGANTPFSDRETFRKLTYKVVVDHKFGADTMGYVSFSRGYKSGTFNTLPLDGPPSRPEVVQAYEAGLKTELFDKRLRLNLAVYQNDVADPQVQVIRFVNGVGAVVLTNAGKARTRGVELGGQALLADGLTLRFAADYLDAKFLDFQNAPFSTQLFDPPYGFNLFAGDASGNREPQSPKFKGNIGLNNAVETGYGEFIFDTAVSYTSSYFWAPDNNYRTNGFALWDASILYRPTFNPKLGIRFWGKNLTSHQYYQTVLEQANQNGNTAAPAAPRTYGVEFSYKF